MIIDWENATLENLSNWGDNQTVTHLRARIDLPKRDARELLNQYDHDWEPYGAIASSYVSILKPTGFIIPHVDSANPYRTRFQIPLQVAGMWYDGLSGEKFQIKEPYQARYWEPHAVWNSDNIDRVHAIIDFEKIPDDAPDNLGFNKTEMIPEIQMLIDNFENNS